MEIFYFYFFSSAKNKQTNRQTERTLAETPQQLWPITAARYKGHHHSDNGHHHQHNHNHHHHQHQLHDLVIRFLSCLGRWIISQMEIKYDEKYRYYL